MRRDRQSVCILLGAVIATGLASRRYPWLLPTILRDYPGDALWAMAAYLGTVLIWPGITIAAAAAVATSVSLTVETSQLYHAAWIDGIRGTTFGRLILGSGFDWVDLVAYALGVSLAMITDRAILKRPCRK